MKQFVNILLVTMAVLTISALLLQGESPKEYAKTHGECLSNMKQIGIGIMLYAGDHNDHMPLAHNWYMELRAYDKRDLKCPDVVKDHADAIGYAYDSRLHGVGQEKVSEPSSQPMVFDSSSLAINSADPFTSLPVPSRHKEGNNVAYADGHANTVALLDLKSGRRK